MKFGIISDIHGNLEALEAVLEKLHGLNVVQIYNLGDITGYGASSSEVIELLRKNKVESVEGNHDWAMYDRVEAENFNITARKSVSKISKTLSEKDIKYLKDLPTSIDFDSIQLVHGMPSKSNDRYSMVNNYAQEFMISSRVNYLFDRFDKQMAFVGHSHVAEAVEKKNEFLCDTYKIDYNPHRQNIIRIEDEHRYVFSVGSVGQPRDRDPRAKFAILDSDNCFVEYFSVPYNIEKAAAKIIDAGLPVDNAKRLFRGKL